MARLQRRKENVADLSPAVKLLNFLSPRRERNEVRVPNFTTPHSNSLPQGEREVRLELRSEDKIFCRIRFNFQLDGGECAVNFKGILDGLAIDLLVY